MRPRKDVQRLQRAFIFHLEIMKMLINLTQQKCPSIHDELENFRSYILKNRDSLKARDAVKLLKYLKTVSE